MKSYLKYFFVITFFACCSFAYADTIPEFNTLSANNISQTSAYIRGQFDVNNYSYTTGFPVTWFEYSSDRGNLSKKTMQRAQTGGDAIVSEHLQGLQSSTTYYYRTVIKVDDIVNYGEKKTFTTEEKIQTVNTQKDTSNNGFLTPEELMNQYYESTNPSFDDSNNTNDSNQGNQSSVSNNTFSFSLWEFLGIKKKNDTGDDRTDNNLVHKPEEQNTIKNSDNQKVKTQTDVQKNKQSAAYDDELGEVIEFNYDTQYNNQYKTLGTKQVKTQSTLNYSILFLIVILLLIVVFLIHLTLKKRRNILAKQQQSRLSQQNIDPNYTPRYSIPVKRDVHDPNQNPNTTFFRKK